MTRHTDMITLIADLFMDAYMAGQQTELSSYNRARADRDRLFDVVRDLYAELEHESYQREQFEVDLMKANNELANLRDLVAGLRPATTEASADAEGEALYEGSNLTDPENPDSPLWSDFAPGAEDMEPELRDCLPFPDVEDLEGASGLLGGDE